MSLDFDLYCSVSRDEVRALRRVADAARELSVLSVSEREDDGAAGSGIRSESLDLARTELADALSALDAIRESRNGHNGVDAGTLIPWLHEYLRGPGSRNRGWRPAEFEQTKDLASANERKQDIA